jgi:type I restriction enzyme S subunit
MTPPPLDLRPDDWQIVREILERHVPGFDVRAFGSRVRGTARPYSDLDLAIFGPTVLGWDVIAALSDDFATSGLPFRVDVVDGVAASPSFRTILLREGVPVQPACGPRSMP